MRQNRQDRCQRALGSGRTSGEVNDQGTTDSAAHSTAEGRKRCMAKAIGAHHLRQSFDDAVADQPGSLGGDIARSKASASSGNDKVRSARMVAQSLDDLVEVVRKRMDSGVMNSSLDQKASDGRPGEVLLGPLETAVTDGKNDGSGIRTKTRNHKG